MEAFMNTNHNLLFDAMLETMVMTLHSMTPCQDSLDSTNGEELVLVGRPSGWDQSGDRAGP